MARRVHFWSLIFILAAAPLPLGSNRPLAWTLLALAIGILCMTWPFAVSRDRVGQVLTLRTLAVPLTSFALAIGWAILQTVPGFLPGTGDPLWDAAAQALAGVAPPVRPSVSIDREATWTGIMRLLSYGGVFWLFLQHGHLSRRPYQAVEALALIAIAYAVYGLAEFASGAETILGMEKWAYVGDLTSTFVNRNSYATFAGLGLLCCVAATAGRLANRRPGWSNLLLHLRRRTAIFAIGGLAVGLSLISSGSRAGTAAGLIGLISLGLLLAVAQDWVNRRRGAWLIACWAVLIIVGASWLLFASRIFTVGAFDRAIVYRLTLQAIARTPIVGTGLGTFPAVFESLRPTALVLPWHEAHDTYLELALELGIPAALCLLAPIAWGGFRMLRTLFWRGSQSGPVALGAAAIVLVALHSLIDFSTQIPAMTVYWLAILGTGVAQTGLQERGYGRPLAGIGPAAVSSPQEERR
jgi:hypothetical protein